MENIYKTGCYKKKMALTALSFFQLFLRFLQKTKTSFLVLKISEFLKSLISYKHWLKTPLPEIFKIISDFLFIFTSLKYIFTFRKKYCLLFFVSVFPALIFKFVAPSVL